MYQQFFNFKEAPFAIEPNSRFIILNEEHQEALATLIYAIEQREGWALLLGYPGVGKTTLIMALFQEMGDSVVAGVITNPLLEPLDFFNMVALELGMEGPITSKGQFLVALRHLIGRYRQEGRSILLVVDEAHSLTLELLEEIRLLGNLDDGSPRVLNIFLVGQPQVLRLLKQASDQGLMQRFRRYYILKTLDQNGTLSYVRHRIKVAGGDPQVFSPEALAAVHQASGGNCRLINSLCDESLLLAFTREQRTISKEIVLEAADENPALKLQAHRIKPRPRAKAPSAQPAPAARPAEKEPEAEAAPPAAEPKPAAPARRPAPGDAVSAPQKPRGRRAAASTPADDLIPGMAPEAEPAARTAPAKKPGGEKPGGAGPARQAKWPTTPPRKKGLAGRFAASLSSTAPHGMLKRFLVLVVVLGLLGGGYHFLSGGGYGRLKKVFYQVTGLGQPEFYLPMAGQERIKIQRDPLEAGRKDWGPVAPAPVAVRPDEKKPEQKPNQPGSPQGG